MRTTPSKSWCGDRICERGAWQPRKCLVSKAEEPAHLNRNHPQDTRLLRVGALPSIALEK